MRMDLATKVTQAYFDHAYNMVYDFITAPLSMYGDLQQKCIGKLDLADSDRVLCVGLGTGNEIVRIMHTKSNVVITGVDYSATALRNARRKTSECNGQVELLLMDAQRLEFAEGTFDKVLCVHVMDFIRDNEGATNEIIRILKEGGQFVITYPSEGEGGKLALNVLKDTYHGNWSSRSRFISPLTFLARLFAGLVYLPLLFRPKPKPYSREQLWALFARLTTGTLEIEEYAAYQDFIVHGRKITKGVQQNA